MWLDLSIRIRLLHKSKIILHKSDFIMSGVVRIVVFINKSHKKGVCSSGYTYFVSLGLIFYVVVDTNKLLLVYQ